MKRTSIARAAAAVFVLAAGLNLPPELLAAEPNVHVLGVWPDKLRFFDEATDDFIGDMHLRHGAVTWYGNWINRTAHSADFRRLFFITDRLQAVEVVDPARREVVGEVKLSTEDRRVFILGVSPDPSGQRLYMPIRSVELQRDRFLPEEGAVVLYDLEQDRVVERLQLPEEIPSPFWYPAIEVSADGKSVYVFSSDVFVLDAETFEIEDRLVLSKPILAGYGAYQGLSFAMIQTGPDLYYGIYSTQDPFLERAMVGIARLDLGAKRVEELEIGTGLELERLAFSPDGTRCYAGVHDLVVVDMESGELLEQRDDFETGRTNDSLIVSADGTKLYISGVGDSIHVHDAATLEPIKTIFAGGDFTSAPYPLPRAAVLPASP